MEDIGRTALLFIRHAVENASSEPITDDGIIAILRGEGGTGSHLRAVFGDVSLHVLASAGPSGGVTASTPSSRPTPQPGRAPRPPTQSWTKP